MTEEDYRAAFDRFKNLTDEQVEGFDDLCEALDAVKKKHYDIHGNPYPGTILTNRIIAMMALELALDCDKLNWERE